MCFVILFNPLGNTKVGQPLPPTEYRLQQQLTLSTSGQQEVVGQFHRQCIYYANFKTISLVLRIL